MKDGNAAWSGYRHGDCDDGFMGRGVGTWEPLSPAENAIELGGVPCRWWIAGGWAIDLHLGR